MAAIDFDKQTASKERRIDFANFSPPDFALNLAVSAREEHAVKASFRRAKLTVAAFNMFEVDRYDLSPIRDRQICCKAVFDPDRICPAPRLYLMKRQTDNPGKTMHLRSRKFRPAALSGAGGSALSVRGGKTKRQREG
ncbi:MAG TPA: hypothetical protein DEA80_19500 [Afipia sp.]|nr:hypothetical protein BBta_7255 [Bradyrhizobium sp. BTAi1]MAH68359.1 hypothetical protein [Afipia sp.]OUX62502.1 MAG: hypothetical protein CBB64_03845 [Afipia sp. TMED4]HAO43108.1 hypothetical protein [Afipia sp.]HAP11165.1 hypothetical protein [Afipia sp.]